MGRAKVTRGALYHHFADKRDLFRAVHEQMEKEIVDAIAARMDGTTDPLELLKIGTRAFLDACMDPAHAQVNLLDAPSVLGWAEWREIDMRYGMGLITAGLQARHRRRRPARPAGAPPRPPAARGHGRGRDDDRQLAEAEGDAGRDGGFAAGGARGPAGLGHQRQRAGHLPGSQAVQRLVGLLQRQRLTFVRTGTCGASARNSSPSPA